MGLETPLAYCPCHGPSQGEATPLSSLGVPSMSLPSVAIVVIQRERYSPTMTCLSRLMSATSYPFHLIYVDGNSPKPTHQYLQRMAKRHLNLKLIRLERHLRVNEARNFALAMLPDVDYVVFLDNDVLVEPGWLEQLISCAEKKQADVVIPLVLDGNGHGLAKRIHIAGLKMSLKTKANGRQQLSQSQLLHRHPLPKNPLHRKNVDGVEAHCFLVRTAILKAIKFDPLVDEPFSYIDLSLQLKEQERRVLLEPAAQVTFLNPQLDPSFDPTDLGLYQFRWSDRSLRETTGYLERKWNLCPHRSGLGGVCRWAVANRQLPLKRATNAPWRFLLKGSKLALCPDWLRAGLELHLQRKPIQLSTASH